MSPTSKLRKTFTPLEGRHVLTPTDARNAVAAVIADSQTTLTAQNDGYQTPLTANNDNCQPIPTVIDEYQTTPTINNDICQITPTAENESSLAQSTTTNDHDSMLQYENTSADQLSQSTSSPTYSSGNLLQNSNARLHRASNEIVSHIFTNRYFCWVQLSSMHTLGIYSKTNNIVLASTCAYSCYSNQ